MGQNRRNVCCLSLIIFLLLLAHSCLSAPINSNITSQVSTNETLVGNASQSVTVTNDTTKTHNIVPSTHDQSPVTETELNSPAMTNGSDSTTKASAPKENDTIAIHPKTTNEQEHNNDMTVIATSDNTGSISPVSVNSENAPPQKDNNSEVIEPTEEPALSETAVMVIEETPTTTVKAPEVAKTPPKQGEATQTEKQATVQSTDPDLLPAQDIETTPSLYSEEDDDEEDDEDDGDLGSDFSDFAINSNIREQYTMVQRQPDGVEKSRVEPADIYDTEGENSHFFFHLVILAFLVAIVYITYHNKRKIFLLAQSRRWRDSLCSRNTVEYHRLDTNVNEAMPSLKMTRDYIF